MRRKTSTGRITVVFNLRLETRKIATALKQMSRFGLIVLSAAALAGCSSMPTLPSLNVFSSSSSSTDADGAKDKAPELLYKEADAYLSSKSFEKAAKRFEEVDRQHPYSPYARRAIIMSAYSYYRAGMYDEAIQGATRYTTLHPGTKESALAQHVIAMSHFDQIPDHARDQSKTKSALKALEKLQRRYPNSSYSAEAKQRIRLARDVLAAAEMNVGRYYLKRNNYLAAINRFKTVVINYQTTNHVEEALARLAEAYMALGVVNEAQTAAAILGHNFPNSKWYKDTYTLLASGGLAPREDSGSWLSKTWKSTISSVSSVSPF